MALSGAADRLARTFAIVGQYADGAQGERSVFSVRTPSCRHRLTLTAPRKADPGGFVTLTVRDTFDVGRTTARVCLAGLCKGVRLPPGDAVGRVRLRVRPRTGIRPLKLAAPGQRLEQSIAVGVPPTKAVASGPTILTTGDSLMQSVDAILGDRLSRRANPVSDVKVASGLTRSTVVDFPKLARQQVRRYRPAATAVFLGTNDVFSMITPEGVEVPCCGEAWGAEYERRVIDLMQVYTQGGTAFVAWLTVPAMRDTRRTPAGIAVNAALRRAAKQVPGAFVVPADKLLTPNGVFEPTVTRRGRQVPIREDDGIHLTIPGARIVAAALVKGLSRAGVLVVPAVVLALLLALGLAADASAYVRVTVDATSERGQLTLYGITSRDIPTATIYEIVDGRDQKVADIVPAPWIDDETFGPLSISVLTNGAQWRCDRLDRTFAIVGHDPDGADAGRGVFSVRTPSCRHRLSLKAPRRAKPGRFVTATVRDTFGTGRIQARVCLAGRCKALRLRPGDSVGRLRLRVLDQTGIKSLRLTAPGQRLEQSIAVGVPPGEEVASGPTVLITGDSLMQSVDAIISDRLASRANVVSDVKIASSLTRTTVVDYSELSRQQVRRHEPAATAIFLGANDFFPMTTPEGAEVQCCGGPWGVEYERRARALMETYAQRGTAAVAWLAVPAMRDSRRDEPGRVVNAAIRRAAEDVPGAFIVPVDELLTPDGVYRPTVKRGGRQVPIREDDGIHLTIAGARIVAVAALEGLREAGVF